jgi:Protein of unknown function (DUF3048) N-terminal domain/Protein of unknown function (DUF3048) C-terminal domain
MTASVAAHPRATASVVAGVAIAVVAVVLAAQPRAVPPPVANVTAPMASSLPSRSAMPTAVPSATTSPAPSATPTPLPSGIADLTGVAVDDSLAHRLPIAVMIDDNRIARPQSGFNGASIVYQAPADGGETRYMLVFQEGDSRGIGPVRSARLYFIHWAAESRSAYAHYGGDAVSRAYLKANDGDLFTDVDALRTTGRPFHRIASRSAPHNAYTSTAAIRAVIAALGGPAAMPAALPRRTFVDPAPLAGRGSRQTIRIPYRTGVVTYTFDRDTDLYLRSVDGRAQIDPADGRRVTTRNVVVLFMPFRIDTTIERGHARPVVGDKGQGRAIVFQNGHAIAGTWTKSSDGGLTVLEDRSGAEIPVVRGRTFIQVVPPSLAVTPRA